MDWKRQEKDGKRNRAIGRGNGEKRRELANGAAIDGDGKEIPPKIGGGPFTPMVPEERRRDQVCTQYEYAMTCCVRSRDR